MTRSEGVISECVRSSPACVGIGCNERCWCSQGKLFRAFCSLNYHYGCVHTGRFVKKYVNIYKVRQRYCMKRHSGHIGRKFCFALLFCFVLKFCFLISGLFFLFSTFLLQYTRVRCWWRNQRVGASWILEEHLS